MDDFTEKLLMLVERIQIEQLSWLVSLNKVLREKIEADGKLKTESVDNEEGK